jgi:hypothetical protein
MQWSDLLKNLDTLKSYVPIVTAVSGTLFGISWLGYWNWRKRRRKRQIPAGVSPLLVLPPGTKDVLRQLMGATEQNQNDPLADFNILYQQRQPDREIRRV